MWRLILVAADGSQFEDECEILINGSGVLNAAWDGNYDLTGKNVAVIGGGSSAVQIIPNIQPDCLSIADLKSDTDEQLDEFRKDPAKLAKYSRDIEGELNKRFTLVCISST
ncbi:unnamed protein product [Sphagnum balticum]